MKSESTMRRTWKKRAFTLSLLAGWIAALPLALFAQQVETATLEGRVRDVRGGALAGAIVQVSTQDGRRVGIRETSALGQYRITGLPAGTYRLNVRRISYRPDTSQVTLTQGQSLTLDITLAAAPIALEPITSRHTKTRTRMFPLSEWSTRMHMAILRTLFREWSHWNR